MAVHLTIFQRGLVLVFVPLVFQLVFIALVAGMQKRYENAQAQAQRSREVAAQTQVVLRSLLDAETGARGFVLSADPTFREPFASALREAPQALERLQDLVADNPEQLSRAKAIASQAGEFLGWQEGVERLMGEGERERALARVKTGEGKRQMDALRQEIAGFLEEQQRLEDVRDRALVRSHRGLGGLLVAGSGLAFLLTLALAFAFHRSVGGRLAAVTGNVQRLAKGEALTHPIRGSDEIGRVDRAFHDMAAALARSQGALREQSRLLQSVLDHMGDGLVVADARGQFVIFNPAAERILGQGATQADPEQWPAAYGLYLPDKVSRFPADRLPLVRALRGEACDQVEIFVRNPRVAQGAWVSATARPLRDGQGDLSGGVVVFHDISDRKRAEEEIQQLNEELELRVVERTAELVEANRDLAHKNQENETFVYSVSHDLRSPLVNLQGFSNELGAACRDLRSLLARDDVPAAVRDAGLRVLDRDMAESLHYIQTGVLRLSNIIDALLRLSRAGRVEYQWQPVDMRAVVTRVVESLAVTIAERGATVTVHELPPAWGAATALEQVFANLIGNALNYLDPRRPGRIEVGSRAAGMADADLEYYFVKDNGLGIPAAYQAKVFQAFQRAHPEVAKGEGMGLAIVRRIVERHRGKVWVESEPGVGSTFFVALPRVPSGVPS